MTSEESLALMNLPEATTRRWQVQLSESHRHYHKLDHVKAMLKRYGGVDAGVVAAIWLHDIVYDPKASDNEERSLTRPGPTCPPVRTPILPCA